MTKLMKKVVAATTLVAHRLLVAGSSWGKPERAGTAVHEFYVYIMVRRSNEIYPAWLMDIRAR